MAETDIIEGIDPTKWSVDVMSYSQAVLTWVSILLWALIAIFGIWMISKYLQYTIPVEIYEKQGTSLIMTGRKKARRKIKNNVEEFELLWNIRGLLPKQQQFLKWFRMDKPEYAIPTSKGVSFKLLKVADAFSPIIITNPDVRLEIVPQNLLWWFSNKIRQINEKYDDRKWWEAYIMPFSIIVVAIICLLMIILTLDKVSGIQEFCAGAQQSLAGKFTQSIK